MWLLDGKRVPDRATIARFRSLHFAPCAERIMAEVTEFLHLMGEIYTFVWKNCPGSWRILWGNARSFMA